MCTSKCSGSCISKQSLVELNDLLNDITTCVPEDTVINNFTEVVSQLKLEARSFLDEVGQQAETSVGTTINSPDYIGKIFEELSFKERMNELKQKIHGLTRHEML